MFKTRSAIAIAFLVAMAGAAIAAPAQQYQIYSNKLTPVGDGSAGSQPLQTIGGGSGGACPNGTVGAIQSTDGTNCVGTNITGLVKGNGGSAPSTATAGTDYAAPTTGTSLLAGDGAGGFQPISLNAGLLITSNALGPTVSINAQTGTGYALQTGDGAKLVSLSNAAAIAETVAGGGTSGFGAGYGVENFSIGVGKVTLTLGTGIFDNGLSAVSFTQGQECYYWNDGTNGHCAMSLPPIAADSILGNFSAASLQYPVGGALLSCSGASNALTYNTTTHAFGCNTISGGSGSPGGSTEQFQYNNAGAFGGIATLAYNGSTVINSANGAASTPVEEWTGTIATGSATTAFPYLYYNCSGATAPTSFNTTGTIFGANECSGATAFFLDLHVNGAGSVFSVSATGALNAASLSATGIVQAGATQNIKWSTRATLASPADGIVRLSVTTSGTPTFRFGGDTSAFSAIQSNGTTIAFRLADNSGDAAATMGALTASAAVTLSGVTTGTNADFACFAAGGVMTLQATACTISSLRFKDHVHSFVAPVLPALALLNVATFKYKTKNVDPNGNVYQLGLIAEDVAKKMPICANFEPDMKTPKSYKQECLIAALVKGFQEQHAEIAALKKQIARR